MSELEPVEESDRSLTAYCDMDSASSPEGSQAEGVIGPRTLKQVGDTAITEGRPSNMVGQTYFIRFREREPFDPDLRAALEGRAGLEL